jgi:hypothetical protein
LPSDAQVAVGALIGETARVALRANCVGSVASGVQIRNSSDVAVFGNYIAPQSGSAIQYLASNTNAVIERNHRATSRPTSAGRKNATRRSAI